MSRVERAEQYYQYIVNNRKLWCHGFTLNRLKLIKDAVLSNNDIMWDLLDRHQCINFSPEEMMKHDRFQFDHATGNLATSILYTMMEKGLIKR